MPALGEYANVYDSALEVLRAKGFDVWYDEDADMFCCQRDGWDFMADGPISLLGLVALYEHQQPTTYREYWWRREGPLHYRSLDTASPAYVPVTQRHR